MQHLKSKMEDAFNFFSIFPHYTLYHYPLFTSSGEWINMTIKKDEVIKTIYLSNGVELIYLDLPDWDWFIETKIGGKSIISDVLWFL